MTEPTQTPSTAADEVPNTDTATADTATATADGGAEGGADSSTQTESSDVAADGGEPSDGGEPQGVEEEDEQAGPEPDVDLPATEVVTAPDGRLEDVAQGLLAVAGELGMHPDLPATEVVTAPDGRLEDVAQGLLAVAGELGMHPHVVDYLPRVGGFVVPREVAEAYAQRAAADATGDTVADTPSRPRQVRAATVKAAPVKRASKKAAKAAAEKEGGPVNG